jgi:hypothetical protein
MSDQIPLFVEDLTEAIRATVQALGGFKKIGAELKPELPVEQAGRWLADCLSPEKREKLGPNELALIRRKARAKGVHILAAYEAHDAGYAPPVPIEPEDERAQLQRAYVDAVGRLEAITRGLQQLSGRAA